MSSDVEDSNAVTTKPTDRERRLGMRVVAWTRFVVVAPVVGLFVAALILVAVASIDGVLIVLGVLKGHADIKEITVEFIEIADVYLLAIVLYIIALGLFELFIDDGLPLPEWLEFHHLDDLKEKLVSVVIVVLGVFFLGKVIEGSDFQSLMYLGIGIAAMVAALTYFVGRVLAKGHGPAGKPLGGNGTSVVENGETR